MDLSVVTGGQYGSEAKGHVTKQIVDKAISNGDNVINIRVAGPNAGHSAVDANGIKHAFRTIPIGMINNAGEVTGYIAAGSEVDMDVLRSEIQQMRAAGLDVSRLIIHPEVTMIEKSHKMVESGLVGRIGSTGKGIGAARADRLLRDAKRLADMPVYKRELAHHGIQVNDLNLQDYAPNTHVVIEGTQGYGLGLHAGHYPQCTSSDARAIDFLAMAGISPWDDAFTEGSFTVWVTLRPYPIRVAGNSGPLYNETSWEELGLPIERTTVTQKVRRVGHWDPVLAWDAVHANGGSPVVKIAFTMLDQVLPELEGVTSMDEISAHFGRQTNLDLFNEWNTWYERVSDAGAKIGLITTSDRTAVWL